MDIVSLKKALVKNPKSLLFACLADELRRASRVQGYKQQLDEALAVANKGLEANRDFLLGKFARGRILFEKGDFVGAKADFEVVTERDPFCISAQKLLMEASEKLGKPTQSEIYAKILSAFEPENTLDAKNGLSLKPFEKSTQNQVSPASAPVVAVAKNSAAESKSVNAALDNILSEENNEVEISELLLKSFGSIFDSIFEGTPKIQESAKIAQEPTKIVQDPPKVVQEPKKVQEGLPPLPESFVALESTSLAANNPHPSAPSVQPLAPNIDDLIKEQLADKTENLPNLTKDMESLLSTNSNHQTSIPPATSIPNIDDLIKEQLADKTENLPNLTSDIESLLKAKPEDKPEAKTEVKTEAEPELKPYIPKKSKNPTVDDLIKEQLVDKVDNLPDLTGDINSLLKSNEMITQTPTLTLAELYLDQGLPQKAVEVYKELLSSDPNNAELQKKLALAEKKI